MRILWLLTTLALVLFVEANRYHRTRGLSSSSSKKEEKSKKDSKKSCSANPIQTVCDNLDGTPSVNDGTPGVIADVLIAIQPNCRQTCNTEFDTFYGNFSGLQDSPGNVLNTLKLSEVASELKLRELEDSFGPLKIATKKQRECILTPEVHEDELMGPTPYVYYASEMMSVAVDQFAPGSWDPTTGTPCDRELGSMGLWYDSEKNQIQAVCNPDSAGRIWNDFAVNGSLTELFEKCGYEFEQDYWLDMVAAPACNALLVAGTCQKNISQSGGNYDSCYCAYGESNGVGIHCPMYGPIYYVNTRVVWQLGGRDYLGNMPGNRVFCNQVDTASSCTNMCETSTLTLEDFPACAPLDID